MKLLYKIAYNKCLAYFKAAFINTIDDIEINYSGMRPESLELVKKHRLSGIQMRPIEIEVYPELDKPILSDGRHRLQIAKENNDSSINAIIRYYDNDGNVVNKEFKVLKLK